MAAHLNRRRNLILAAAAVAAGLLAGCDKAGGPSAPAATPASFKGIDITGAEYARELSLPDANGKLRTLADFKGKVVVVFFGFTQCPDVCPSTMAELAAVKRELGPDGDRVVGIFVTVDPERDTPPILKAYVEAFDPSFVALRGTIEETKAAAKHFKIFYAKVPGKSEGSYSVDHTAGSFIFDPQGRVRLFTRYGTGAPALVHDLKILLAQK
jgi:protein SCO1/2